MNNGACPEDPKEPPDLEVGGDSMSAFLQCPLHRREVQECHCNWSPEDSSNYWTHLVVRRRIVAIIMDTTIWGRVRLGEMKLFVKPATSFSLSEWQWEVQGFKVMDKIESKFEKVQLEFCSVVESSPAHTVCLLWLGIHNLFGKHVAVRAQPRLACC